MLTFGEEIEVPVDLVVMAVGQEVNDIADLVEKMKIPGGADRFSPGGAPEITSGGTSSGGYVVGGQLPAMGFTRNGRPIKPIREVFEAACRETAIEGFTLHDGRHNAINNWRLQGHDYFRIMAATGPKTMKGFKRCNTVSSAELKSLVGKNR